MLLRYKARSAFRTARLFIYNAVQRYVSVGPVSGKSRTITRSPLVSCSITKAKGNKSRAGRLFSLAFALTVAKQI